MKSPDDLESENRELKVKLGRLAKRVIELSHSGPVLLNANATYTMMISCEAEMEKVKFEIMKWALDENGDPFPLE